MPVRPILSAKLERKSFIFTLHFVASHVVLRPVALKFQFIFSAVHAL